VAEARDELVHNAPPPAFVEDDKRLADVEAKLARVRVISPVGRAHLERIRDQVQALLAQAATERVLTAVPTGTEPPGSTARPEHAWRGPRGSRRARTGASAVASS
jgi:hypothetical protein